MRYHEIHEARRNPDQNPKHTVYDQIKDYLNEPNAFVSFTAIDKLGINPSSRYQTPIGIYSYPLMRTIEEENIDVKANGLYNQFPFASKSDYFWLFEAADFGSMLILSDAIYSRSRYVTDIKKLEQYYTETAPENVKESFNDFISKAAENARYGYKPGQIWNITRCAAAGWNPKASRTDPVKWNTILRKVLGYSGAIDIEALGIIHPSEPLQAVFFSKSAIKPIMRVANKQPSLNSLFPELRDMFDSLDFRDWLMKADKISNLNQIKLTQLAIPYMSNELVTDILVYPYNFRSLFEPIINNIPNPADFFTDKQLFELALVNVNTISSYALSALLSNPASFAEFLKEKWSITIMSSTLIELIMGYMEHGPEQIRQLLNTLPEQIVIDMILKKPALYHTVNDPTEAMTALYQALTRPK